MNGAGVPGENRERGTAGGMLRGRNIMCEMLKRSLMKCVSVYGKAS